MSQTFFQKLNASKGKEAKSTKEAKPTASDAKKPSKKPSK